MATLTLRDLEDDLVSRLRLRAAEHGRSIEAEHREILRVSLLGKEAGPARGDAPSRLSEFRQRTGGRSSHSTVDLLAETRSGRVEQLAGKDA